MRQTNQAIISFASAAVDAVLTFVAYLLAIALRFRVLDGVVSISMDSPRFQAMAWGYAVMIVLIYSACHLYQPFRVPRLGRDVSVVLLVNTLSALVLMALLFTFKLMDISRWTIVIFWAISTALMVAKRVLVVHILQRIRMKDQYLLHVIVVGNGKNAREYIREVRSHPELGIRVEGYVSCMPKAELGENLGSYEEIGAILEAGDYDELVVALEPHEVSFMPLVLSAAEKEGTRVEMIPMYQEYYPTHPTFESVGNTRLVDLRATPLDNIALAALKRAMDLAGSAALLVALMPLMAAIAVGVKLSGPGPVLFKQERIGKNKKPFVMLKFRSMRSDIDHNGWSTNSDSRKTRFGSFIRKFSLDELPQLFNVLLGQMSLVGPRPELPVYVRRFKEEVPLYLVRQQVRPGMTGWAQVNGLRGDTSIEERVVYDIWYIQNWSIWLDIRILFKTVFGGMKNAEELVRPASESPAADSDPVQRQAEGESACAPEKIAVVVATHVAYPMPEAAPYLPVQAGAALHDRLPYTGDDSGEGISEKNGVYCELTALYWAWKNLEADAVGLCHYRRYFREPGSRRPATAETFEALLREVPVILPRKRNYWIETGVSQFMHAHGSECLEALKGVLREKYPRHLEAFERSMARTAGHRFNMLVMRRAQLDAYCGWLFDVLFETEKRIQPPPRMMGFLAERLMDAWIEAEGVPYRELPVYHTERVNWIKKGGAFLLRKVRGGAAPS